MRTAMRDLTPLLLPRSVAVIGASTNPSKSGGVLFHNLIAGGFPGRLYPINPRAAEVQGHRAYPSLREVPEPVDLVFIVVPRERVAEAMADCAANGARSASIITAGYREAGAAEEQAALARFAREHAILTVGPNTIGHVSARARL